MAKQTESERFGLWSSRIEDAEKRMKNSILEWTKYIQSYRLDMPPDEIPADGAVWINWYFALTRLIIPNIYYRNPDVVVSARGITPVAYAEMLTKMLNYQLEEIFYEEEMCKIIFDALYCGFGVMKYGYAPALNRRKKRSSILDVSFEDLFELDDDTAVSETEKGDFEPNQLITDSNPFAVRIAPRFMKVDPLATSLKDARWVAHSVLIPVEELKKSKRYNKGLTSGIEGTHWQEDEALLNSSNPWGYPPPILDSSQSLRDLVMLHEIWDIEHDKLLVMDSYNQKLGQHKFLRSEDWPYDIEGFPFDFLVFNRDPDRPFGVADAATWYNPQKTINFLNSAHWVHARRFGARKYVVQDGAFDENELYKFTSPDDGSIVKSRLPVGESVMALQDAPLPPDVYALRDILRNDLTYLLAGVTQQRRGESTGAKTATEASIMEQQARLRDSDRLATVGKFVEGSVKKILQLDRQFLDPSQVSFMVGPQESALWYRAGEDIIKAEVDVKVRVGSSGYTSREVQVKQMLDFLNLTGNLAEMDPATGQPVPLVNRRELIRRIADKMDLEDYETLLAPPGTPPVAPAPPPGEGGPEQGLARRTGASNLADMLSGVQNLGARRSSTPNPTSEMGQG